MFVAVPSRLPTFAGAAGGGRNATTIDIGLGTIHCACRTLIRVLERAQGTSMTVIQTPGITAVDLCKELARITNFVKSVQPPLC